MPAFSEIELTLLSGPGIAAPVAEFYVVKRPDCGAGAAQELDRLIGDCDFFGVESIMPTPHIADGPHRSKISIRTSDGTFHKVEFSAAAPPPGLNRLIEYIQFNCAPI